MSYEEDVRFVGAYLRGGKWEVALRIARNVTPDAGNGGRPEVGPRHSFNQFAKDSGHSIETVRRYYKAWQKAAADGVVDPAETLSADSEYDWENSGLTQEDWDGFYTEARYGGSNAKKRPASKQDVIDAIKDNPEIAEAAWEAIEEKAIERAQDAQLAAIQRGGCATKVDKDKLGSAWAAVKGAAKRGEAIQALEDALGVLEAAANLVLANGNPVDNEGDQINTLANRVADVAGSLFSLTMIEVAQ